jgi:hypothetical protein
MRLLGELTADVAQQVFEQDADSEGQAVDRIERPGLHELVEAVVGDGVAA